MGMKVSQLLAARVGGALLRFGQGKFTDPASFINHRGGELLWLLALAVLGGTAHWLLDGAIRRRFGKGRWRWAPHAGLSFVVLNLWMAAAGNTALFWGAVGLGAGFQNLMQFHFKRILFEESPVASRAVLVGNSQTRAQIDEELLNQQLGTNLWTAELHFPGSRAFDVLLIERQFRRANPQIVICYLNETYFYNGSAGETVPNFFAFRDLPETWRLGGMRYLERQGVFYGLLGDLVPLFRDRDALAQRVLGSLTLHLKQSQYNAALDLDLEARARELAVKTRLNDESKFQKDAFEELVARCQRAHRRVIILFGQCNPILTGKLDPILHEDLAKFLEQLHHRYSNLVIVGKESMPEQTAADYEDLTHINPEAQRRFSLWLVDYLKKDLATPSTSPATAKR